MTIDLDSKRTWGYFLYSRNVGEQVWNPGDSFRHFWVPACPILAMNAYVQQPPTWLPRIQTSEEWRFGLHCKVRHQHCAEVITVYEGNSEWIMEEREFEHCLWSWDQLNYLFRVSLQEDRPMRKIDKVLWNLWGKVGLSDTRGGLWLPLKGVLRVATEGSITEQWFQLLCSESRHHHHTKAALPHCFSQTTLNVAMT